MDTKLPAFPVAIPEPRRSSPPAVFVSPALAPPAWTVSKRPAPASARRPILIVRSSVGPNAKATSGTSTPIPRAAKAVRAKVSLSTSRPAMAAAVAPCGAVSTAWASS
ncbi:MAG: hypothetical protein DDT35_01575 [Firmicutes bacterium]|nr:hypothetical protein [Bacillota bacterium]